MALPQIDGLDTAAGLKFFAGRKGAYLRALQTFAALYADGLPAPDGASAPMSGLQQAAHSLAGASLVLGAAALGAHAQRLSALLTVPQADAGEADMALQATQQALARLVQQLQARMPAS